MQLASVHFKPVLKCNILIYTCVPSLPPPPLPIRSNISKISLLLVLCSAEIHAMAADLLLDPFRTKTHSNGRETLLQVSALKEGQFVARYGVHAFLVYNDSM